jgi:putative SOS response-associated peptidase YedK
MCGRYAFYQVRRTLLPFRKANSPQRPSEVRQQLAASNMPADEAPDDDAIRTSYNFAPGYNGLVYRADVPDWGLPQKEDDDTADADDPPSKEGAHDTHYKLQAMKWGASLVIALI